MSELPSTFVEGFHDEDAVKKMPYNLLGHTGLKVSKLSLGTGGFSTLYGNYTEKDCIETTLKAIKSGINYIDTAPWYGQGSSEEVLGKALCGIPRQAYYIATKVGRYEKDPHKMFDFSAEKTRWSVENSLDKLGLDYVDIIQVHDIEFADNLDIIVNECLPTLVQFLRAGKAHFIGITGYPVSVLKECIEKSKIPISTILSYTRMTLIDETLSDYMLYFNTEGLGVINAASVCMGLLSNNGPQAWHPADDKIKALCKNMADYCKENGVELGRLAMDFAFCQPGPATHLAGMNNLDHLNANMDLLLNGLTEKEKKVLEDIREKFCPAGQKLHWEGIEIARYRKTIGKA